MIIVSFLPVLAAAAASVVLAYLWYHPKLFGRAWMALAGVTPEMAERGKKKMALNSVIALLASMLVAYVMSYVGILLGIYDWLGALQLGFWCWLGFTAPPMLGMVLWEQKPFRYYALVAGYWLVAFILMAFILLYTSTLFGMVENDSNFDQTGETLTY